MAACTLGEHDGAASLFIQSIHVGTCRIAPVVSREEGARGHMPPNAPVILTLTNTNLIGILLD